MFVVFPEISAFFNIRDIFSYTAHSSLINILSVIKRKSQKKIFPTKKIISEECAVIEIIPFDLSREEEKLSSVSL